MIIAFYLFEIEFYYARHNRKPIYTSQARTNFYRITVILGRLAQMVSNGTAAILIPFMVLIETIRNVIR